MTRRTSRFKITLHICTEARQKSRNPIRHYHPQQPCCRRETTWWIRWLERPATCLLLKWGLIQQSEWNISIDRSINLVNSLLAQLPRLIVKIWLKLSDTYRRTSRSKLSRRRKSVPNLIERRRYSRLLIKTMPTVPGCSPTNQALRLLPIWCASFAKLSETLPCSSQSTPSSKRSWSRACTSSTNSWEVTRATCSC